MISRVMSAQFFFQINIFRKINAHSLICQVFMSKNQIYCLFLILLFKEKLAKLSLI